MSLVRLAVERVASAPENEQRYLELIFALDRAVERHLRYQDLQHLFRDGAAAAPARDSWAWRLAAGLTANLRGDSPDAHQNLDAGWHVLYAAGRGNTPAGSFLHTERSRAYYHDGEYVQGIESATRALQLARAANSILSEAYAHHYLGINSIRRRELPYAYRHLAAARDLFERMKQRHGRARVLDSLAWLEMEYGRYDSAREILHESLAVKRSLRDLRGEALTSLNLARVHTNLGNYEEALAFLERARDLAFRIGDERNATLIRVQMGELHLRHQRPVEAREELLIARQMAKLRDDTRMEAMACHVLAEAERLCGSPEGALEAIRVACEYFPSSGDAVAAQQALVRQALIHGESLMSPEIRGPLDQLRELDAHGPLADSLFEIASHLRERGETFPVASLYAEALDNAEPYQAEYLANQMRDRADGPEGLAWIEAMLTVKEQKDRLEQAFRELRRAEALRDALTQMIVHDLKNPLASITPWLQMAQDDTCTPEEGQGYIQTAINECDYMLRLIEDLNDVGRVQHAGTLELVLEPLDLRELAHDVANRLQGRARDNGMLIVVDDPLEEDDMPPVRGDRNKMRRVMENLIANGIKYGRPPEGSPNPAEIRVSAVFEPGSFETGPGAVRVDVRDFGVGIPVAEAERVFEPYYQAEAGRKRKAGVGLGLAFCRMVLDAHGGAIWTAPNPRGGTIFAFRLPLEESETPAQVA